MEKVHTGQGERRLWALIGGNSASCHGSTGGPTVGRSSLDLYHQERLMQIMRGNQFLLLKLDRIRAGLEGARSYLSHPACNTVLGIVSLNWAKMKRADVLSELQANRVEAHQILSRPTLSAEPSCP
jgi:hypothetical protein